MTIDAVVQEFTLEVIEAVHTRPIVLKAVPVHAVLAKVCMHDQVGIFRRSSVVDVVTVLEFTLHIECE